MRTLFLAFIAVFAFGTTTFAQDLSESEMQEMYMTFLSSEGIESYIDSDGDVQFTYNENNYYITVNVSDQSFFNLVLPNYWPIESEEEWKSVLYSMDAANAKAEVAKAYSRNDHVWFGTELFLDQPEQFKDVFMKCLNALEQIREIFVDEM